jgi:mitochondrial fission protein ELM1
MSSPTVWIITDGKAGDLGPCLAVAQAAHWEPKIWHLKPNRLWSQMLMGPYGIIHQGIGNQERCATHRDISSSLVLHRFSPLTPSTPLWPDVLIASGRRTIPVVRLIRKWTKGKTFTVFLKDPRTLRPLAAFTWVFEHDPLRGSDVYATLTTPHRLSPSLFHDLRTHAYLHPHSFALPKPRIAVLIGGNSRHHVFTPSDQARLISDLTALMKQGYHLMITTSRRTPEPLKKALLSLALEDECLVWDGETKPNPYAMFLALADYIVVTTDSINMMSESLATGMPLLLFEPQGGHHKITQFTRILKDKGYAFPFHGSVAGTPYPPIDSTPQVATRMLEAFTRWKNKSKDTVKMAL